MLKLPVGKANTLFNLSNKLTIKMVITQKVALEMYRKDNVYFVTVEDRLTEEQVCKAETTSLIVANDLYDLVLSNYDSLEEK